MMAIRTSKETFLRPTKTKLHDHVMKDQKNTFPTSGLPIKDNNTKVSMEGGAVSGGKPGIYSFSNLSYDR